MLREEAIKQLKDNRVLCINSETEPFAIAYDMAIKALEQEPTPKNDLGVDCNNCKNNLHRGDGTSYCATGDGMCHYECEEPTTKNNLGVDTDKLIADCEKMSFDIDFFNKSLKVIALDAVKNIVNEMPSVTPQEPINSVLEDIKAELNEFKSHYMPSSGVEWGIKMCLEIIDKYKAETER